MNGLRRFGASALAVFKDVPAALRTQALFLVSGTVLATAVVVFLHRFDPVFEAFAREHQRDDLVYVAQKLSAWGELHLGPLIALLIVAAIGAMRRLPRLLWASLSGLLSGGVGGILVNVIKVVAGRPRPCTAIGDGIHWFTTGWDYASFPSGHATHCFAIAAGVAMLAPRAGIVFVLGSIAVSWSRWYLIRHYITDVSAGAWLGIMIGVVIGLAARRVWERSSLARVGEAKTENVNG